MPNLWKIKEVCKMNVIYIFCTISLIWGLFDFLNIYLIYRFFFQIETISINRNSIILLSIYFIINVVYTVLISFNISGTIIILMYLLFYIKGALIVIALFQKTSNIIIKVFFYQLIIATLGQNIDYLFFKPYYLDTNLILRSNVRDMIITIVFFVILLIFVQLKKTNIVNIYFAELSFKDYIILCGVIYTLGVAECFILSNKDIHNSIRIVFIILLVLVYVLVVQMIVVNEKNFTINSALMLAQEQMSQMKEYYRELNEKNLQIRKFRHDNHNMLLVIHSLVCEGRDKQALKYLEEMQKMQSDTLVCFETGNFIADALISSKQKLANKFNTTLEFEGKIPGNKIEDIDITILLSNLIDNAIEACMKQDGEKNINIDSFFDNNIWVLSIKNPINDIVKIRKNRIETTKKNKQIHGFGLLSIQVVVEKYDGDMILKCSDGIFIAKIVLKV